MGGGKIGSPIASCPAPGSNAPTGKCGAPVDPAKHKNCGIKILSIKEQDEQGGYEFKDSASSISVKDLTKPLCIRYEVKACSMKVTLWVEFDPGNSIHATFYKTYDGKGIISPRVAVVVKSQHKEPGIHAALWDCRDQTRDHRILLGGVYRVRILGLEDLTHKDATTIKIDPPRACNYGHDYVSIVTKTVRKKDKKIKQTTEHHHSTKKQTIFARDSQTKLADGTSFLTEASMSPAADEAWETMKKSSVTLAVTHSSPFSISFYPEENQPGKPALFKPEKTSRIVTYEYGPKVKVDRLRTVVLSKEPATVLRDVFMIVLAGCCAGSALGAVHQVLQHLSAIFNPGRIDEVHGPKTRKALREWQKWENIKDADGEMNSATLARLGVSAALSERQKTREVQTKLKEYSVRYNPGEDVGFWTDAFESAVTNYQEDHNPPLTVTGLPDKPTRKHLKIDEHMGGPEDNVAQIFMHRGCNIALGFQAKVSFTASEIWNMAFWKSLAGGSGIDDAACEARSKSGAEYYEKLAYNIYTRKGVDKNSTLHPARYGRDM